MRLSSARLDEIVTRKAPWIVQRLRRAERHGPTPTPREFVSGESVLYLGRHYRLKVQPGDTGVARLRGGWLHVPAPVGAQQAAHVRAALVAWLRRHAAERLPERVEAWRAKAGVSPSRVVVADQRKRWGSCDQRGAIRLNWRIVQAPMRLVDYVVVHELVHLRHRGHGPRLLAGRGPRHARLRAASGGAAAVRVCVGVVTRQRPPARLGWSRRSLRNSGSPIRVTMT